jgi:hypothetical protein
VDQPGEFHSTDFVEKLFNIRACAKRNLWSYCLVYYLCLCLASYQTEKSAETFILPARWDACHDTGQQVIRNA